jgi:hypothetical protein
MASILLSSIWKPTLLNTLTEVVKFCKYSTEFFVFNLYESSYLWLVAAPHKY